jgi:amino acid transporter
MASKELDPAVQSKSSNEHEAAMESKTYSPPGEVHDAHAHDLENGDKGILYKAAPLAKELKGRHMQMIAIGMNPLLPYFKTNNYRWRNRCWFIYWFWVSFGNWWTSKFGEFFLGSSTLMLTS